MGFSKMNLQYFLQKKCLYFHNNYTNINVNKLLNVKRPLNMFMNVNKFEKKFHLNLHL